MSLTELHLLNSISELLFSGLLVTGDSNPNKSTLTLHTLSHSLRTLHNVCFFATINKYMYLMCVYKKMFYKQKNHLKTILR